MITLRDDLEHAGTAVLAMSWLCSLLQVRLEFRVETAMTFSRQGQARSQNQISYREPFESPEKESGRIALTGFVQCENAVRLWLQGSRIADRESRRHERWRSVRFAKKFGGAIRRE